MVRCHTLVGEERRQGLALPSTRPCYRVDPSCLLGVLVFFFFQLCCFLWIRAVTPNINPNALA